MTKSPNRRVRCLVCDRAVTKNNLRTHVKTHHPGRDAVPLADLFDELGTEVARVAPSVPAAEGPAVDPSTPPDLPPLGPDDLDDIVLAVVGQVAEPTGAIPVEFLPAVFAWREATATFLRSVSDRS